MFGKIFKKPIFVSVSPNAQCDDVWLALKLIFCPWKWKRGKCIEIFEKMLGEYLGMDSRVRGNDKSSVSLFESGRTALYAILLALGIGKGDEVLIQAFTCTAAVNPVLWAGAKPVYVDIEDGTYNMSPDDLEKKVTPGCKALILQNTFGYPGKINELLEIAKKNNLIVIEDCAHNLGAEYNGRKIGAFGEVSFFSFGRSKIISSVFGGAAAVKNPELGKKISEIHNKWNYPSRGWILQQLFHPIYMVFAKPLYNFLSIGKIMIVIGKKIGLVSIMVYPIEKSGGKPPFGPAKMPNALACLAINQMQKLEEFNKHRRKLAEYYNETLRQTQRIKLADVLRDSKLVFLNFPILVSNFEVRQKLITSARKAGIYLESWPAYDKKVIGPDSTNQEKLFYADGSCPEAEKAAQTSVNLPTSPNTLMKDAERVVKFLNGFIGR